MCCNKLSRNMKVKTHINKIVVVVIAIVILLTAPLFFYFGTLFFYRDKVIPKVKVAGYDISGFKKYQLEEMFQSSITKPEKIILVTSDDQFTIPLNEIDFKYDVDKTFENAYQYFRNDKFYNNSFRIFSSFITPVVVNPEYSLDETVFNEYLSVISSKISIEPVNPTILLNGNTLGVSKGSAGREVDLESLKNLIWHAFKKQDFKKIVIPIKKIDPTLDSEQEQKYLNRANTLNGKSITLFNNMFQKSVDTKTIMGFISPHGGYNESVISEYIDSFKNEVETEPQNSVFTFKDGRVQEFVPSKEGIKIKKDELIAAVSNGLSVLESGAVLNPIQIPAIKTAPEITNSEVNDLGINELIGRGESFYKGSILGRIHNIGLASSRISGALIKPGEIFSFNSAVGDVSVLTGYKQAYIIQDGKTILGDGGGVCQVSTTLFRAVLNSGLSIVERAAHSYRVGYYEQNSGPGLDATVYSPTTDFKFKNDTPANILIQTIYEPKIYKLTVEVYGTSDSRVASTTKPVVTSSTPPPEDLYMDDPTLPVGTVKQVDYKSWGAKVIFDYTVTRNGETLYQKKFVSNYKPWQAKFLRGTAPK